MSKTKPSIDPEAIRTKLEEVVSKRGVEPLKSYIGTNLSRMVAGTKALDEGVFNELYTEGYETLTGDLVTVGAEVILAHSEGEERDRLQSDYDFWVANKQRVMELHHISQ